MANTYPSLSVKGMIYICTRGARRYAWHQKKPHKGDVVDQKTPYTLHAARKYVWVGWCMMGLNHKCTTSMGHAKYNTNRTPCPTPSLVQYLWCQFPNFEAAAGGSSHACAQTLFCLAWDTSIYIYTSIHLYSVRITMKVARWMKPMQWYRDGKSEHYWPLDIIYIPPDSATCTI